MVNQAVLLERLEALQDYIDKLRPFQALSLAELTSPDNYANYWAVQRGLELAAQCVIDIATHLQVALRLGHATEYREAIRLLGTSHETILPPDFAEKISAVAGFRNILVHEYLIIDPAQVYQALQDGLDDFELFIKYIYDYLKRTGLG